MEEALKLAVAVTQNQRKLTRGLMKPLVGRPDTQTVVAAWKAWDAAALAWLRAAYALEESEPSIAAYEQRLEDATVTFAAWEAAWETLPDALLPRIEWESVKKLIRDCGAKILGE